MKSYSAYFIHGIDAKELEARAGGERKLRMAFGEVVTPPGSEWLICGFRNGASPPSDDFLWGTKSLIEADSKKYGEMIFLFADTRPDSFVYEHARDGVLLRKLVWFPMLDDNWTPGWLCAQGQPEDWETAILFTPKVLARTIAEEQERYSAEGKDDEFPAREAEIRDAWERHAIAAGGTIPYCDGTVALAVEKHFGIHSEAQG
jgi:hypothetical protein